MWNSLSALGTVKQVFSILLCVDVRIYLTFFLLPAGAHFDLRSLIKSAGATESYTIQDGDIPCTPETEPSFNYIWNFCANVPAAALPAECSAIGKNAVVLQWANYGQGQQYCYIVGHYDQSQHELGYNLLDIHDPSKGLSITYPSGETCDSNRAVTRSATIDVECANTPYTIVSAQEPTTCNYHLTMKSYHGCPTVSSLIHGCSYGTNNGVRFVDLGMPRDWQRSLQFSRSLLL